VFIGHILENGCASILIMSRNSSRVVTARRFALHDVQLLRDLFLTVLEQVRRRYRLVVIGFVVMPEHFHLLIAEPQIGTPSTVMQALKLGFARRKLAEMARTQVSKTARPGAPVLREQKLFGS
jgi:REP element-mobilizing transposase RayT